MLCSEKQILVKNFFKMGKAEVFHFEPGSKRKFIEWKHTDFPENKMFQAQRSVKKVMLTLF